MLLKRLCVVFQNIASDSRLSCCLFQSETIRKSDFRVRCNAGKCKVHKKVRVLKASRTFLFLTLVLRNYMPN